jgi:hypothetical protein
MAIGLRSQAATTSVADMSGHFGGHGSPLISGSMLGPGSGLDMLIDLWSCYGRC